MRFPDFLKTTVLISAAAASVLAVVALFAASRDDDQTAVIFGVAWWVIAAIIGIVLGRRAETNPPISRLLAASRVTPTLPELRPGRMLVNRLWPLFVATLSAGALAFLFPQVPAIAAGFAIIWALAWRKQDRAVSAIEERDGVRFYVERTSPLQPIRLVRTPGFKSTLFEMNGARTPAGRA